MTTTREYVTKGKAESWLRTANTQNRELKEDWVFILAERMNNKEWVETHEGIAFDVDGVLVDGQHRLFALTISNLDGMEFCVTRNLPRDSRKWVDGGKPRTLADVTSINTGQRISAKLVGTIARFGLGTRLTPHTRTMFSVDDVRYFFLKYRDYIEYAEENKTLYGMSKKNLSSSILAAIARCAVVHGTVGSDEAVQALRTGVSDSRTRMRGVSLFRSFYGSSKRNNGDCNGEVYIKCCRALEAYINDEDLSVLRPQVKEIFLLPEDADRAVKTRPQKTSEHCSKISNILGEKV